MQTNKPLALIVSFVLLAAGTAFAQVPADQPWWYILERGKNQFRSGDYGNALLSFEDARRRRRAMYERMERDLIDFLSVREVRGLGDSLDWVERYARERFYASAAAALSRTASPYAVFVSGFSSQPVRFSRSRIRPDVWTK